MVMVMDMDMDMVVMVIIKKLNDLKKMSKNCSTNIFYNQN